MTEPFIEYGVGWAKIHFRRDVTDEDRANLEAAIQSVARHSIQCELEKVAQVFDEVPDLPITGRSAAKAVRAVIDLLDAYSPPLNHC